MEQKIQRKTAKVNGINLFYRDTNTKKQPMLCLHGKWGRGETWTDLMFRYQNKYRIIAPDQRGHGLSDKPVTRYAGEDFAKDAYELIKKLKLGATIVVGHSMGARNAAYLAVLYPRSVKALVILDTLADGPEKLSDTDPKKVSPIDNFTVGWPTPYATYEEAVQDIQNRFITETNVRYFLESLIETKEGYDFIFSSQAMSAIDVYYQKWYHLLSKIKCPVLFVRAKNSWYLSGEEAEKMKAFIKTNFKYYEVSNSDHMVYVDNPDEFYPPFDKFISL
jgi:pimeloyl-ACP methyl ester carboxylesterase